MKDVEDEPLFAERVAGIDIAKAGVEVTIRVPSDTRPGRRQQETRSFGTTRRQLLALADWLRSWGVAKAGMEATGDYWKPVYFVLESQGLDCELYHAAQVRALPGRPKTDRADSVWLAKITERGSLPSSFVPPEPIRRLRTHTRYRRHLTQARTAEKQRVEKLLEDGHLKLSSVISDIHGVSGRAMLEAIIAGERNPKVLAQLARGSMRGKIARLEEALDCSFLTEEHAAVLSMMLTTIDYYTAHIDELTAKIEVLAEPYLHQIEQMDAVHGTGRISAQDVIAESGSPGALPRRGPLGTVLARYQAHGSGKPLGRCGLWCWRPAAAGLWLAPAGGVYQAGSFPVRRAVPVVDEAVGGDGPAGRAQPPAFPFPGGLGRLLGAEQVLPAERAAPVLPGEQAQAVAVQRGFHPPPPRGPVVGQVRVVG